MERSHNCNGSVNKTCKKKKQNLPVCKFKCLPYSINNIIFSSFKNLKNVSKFKTFFKNIQSQNKN